MAVHWIASIVSGPAKSFEMVLPSRPSFRQSMLIRHLAVLFFAAAALRAQAPPATPVAQDDDARDRILFATETERAGPLLKKLVRNTIIDQKEIWTSPFHMHRGDAPWWIGFGAVTAGLIATDKWTSRQLPNTNDQTKISRYLSDPGAVYTLYPIAGAFYLGGALADNAKLREAGALGAEALTDSLIVVSVLKVISGRERPEEGRGNGRFFAGGTSFPSGHSIMSWSLASIVAHEYHATPIIPISAYSLAAIVSASRFSGRKHYASDIIAGGAMGWFIGHYVYRTHADHAIHKHPIGSLRPNFMPVVDPGSRTYGVSLRWSLGGDSSALAPTAIPQAPSSFSGL